MRLRNEGVPVAYMKPKEGILTWLCGLSLLNTGDGDEQMMYDYLDAWASAETGRYVISEYGYGHANSEAFKLVDRATLDNLGFSEDPEEMLKEGYIFSLIPPERYQKYIQLFEDVKAESGV